MKKFLVTVLTICLILSQTACSPQQAAQSSFGEDWLLNTYCYIKTFEKGQEDIITEAFGIARMYESLLSRTDTQSQVYAFNHGEGDHTADPQTFALVKKALDYCEKTDGRFDISVGALAELWNFSGEDPHVPSEADLNEALSHSGCWQSLSADTDNTCEGNVCKISYVLRKEDPKTQIDLGAIAKGFIADKLAEFLKTKNVQSAIISLGGNIYCVGAKAADTDWVIGIEAPQEPNGQALESREQVGTVSIGADMSAVSSGTYERCFTENGVSYHHILDPKTGYPAETDVLSTTVIGKCSADADALSTICLIYGSEEALKLIESTPGYECVLIKRDGSILCSSGAKFTPAK